MSDDIVPEKVDWAEIRRRIDVAGEAIRSAGALTPERGRALLRERAARLARPLDVEDMRESIELVVFARDGERYGIESRFVVEMMLLPDVAPLPGADSDIVGVIAWRGVPLVLSELATQAGSADGEWVVALGVDRPVFGVISDTAPDLVRLPLAEIHEPAKELMRDRRWLTGITDDALLVVDGRALIRIHTEGSRL